MQVTCRSNAALLSIARATEQKAGDGVRMGVRGENRRESITGISARLTSSLGLSSRVRLEGLGEARHERGEAGELVVGGVARAPPQRRTRHRDLREPAQHAEDVDHAHRGLDSGRRFCVWALELGRGYHDANELARVVWHLHQLEAEEVLGLARGHLALGHALAEELVDGGAGVQDSGDGAILYVSGHAPVASGARHHARDACISLSDTHFWVVSFCDPF
jgi:hypothetical protein